MGYNIKIKNNSADTHLQDSAMPTKRQRCNAAVYGAVRQSSSAALVLNRARFFSYQLIIHERS